MRSSKGVNVLSSVRSILAVVLLVGMLTVVASCGGPDTSAMDTMADDQISAVDSAEGSELSTEGSLEATDADDPDSSHTGTLEVAIAYSGTGGEFDPNGAESLWDVADNPEYGASSERFVLSGSGSTVLRWEIADYGSLTAHGPYLMVFLLPVGDTPDPSMLGSYPILETDYYHSDEMEIEAEKGVEIAKGKYYLGVLAANCSYKLEVLDLR